MTGETAFALRERYIEDGFLHIGRLFPTDAVAAAAAAASALPGPAREAHGNPDIQRVQPLGPGGAGACPDWVRTFYDNPRLDRVLRSVFEGEIVPTPKMSRDPQLTGLLVEPTVCWWSTGLHRDYRDFIAGMDLAPWRDRFEDLRFFNQVNIPLLPDSSFWLVPGSHRRDDREDEARLVRERFRYRGLQNRPADPVRTGGFRHALVEGLKACGGVNIAASPGDFVLYRSNMLHCGVYEPGRPRLTLHDAVYSTEWHGYYLEIQAALEAERRAAAKKESR